MHQKRKYMKKYILSYEFLGEKISKPFDDLFTFYHALEVVMEANEVPDSTICVETVNVSAGETKSLKGAENS